MAIDSILDIKYQIVLLDPGATGRAATLRRTLERGFRELGLDPAETAVFLDTASFASRNLKAPVAGVYFGSTVKNPDDTRTVENLLALPAVVFPVVESLDDYPSLVPDALLPINGVPLKPGDPDLEDIANRVFEALLLLRQTRRLFISYRRKESRAVAIQLYVLFDERGYDVFLDTHGVGAGEPFQEVLWHKLADSDIMIMLDTQSFLESTWTRQELERASTMSIGILQVVWPGRKRDRATELAEPLYMEWADFVATRRRLRRIALPQIATAVESLRARSLAARHVKLVREVWIAAQELGIDATFHPYRYILAQKNGHSVPIIPAIGVPTAQQIYEVESLLESNQLSNAALVYDHVGIRDRWLAHLKWLDLHLPVKSFRVSDARQWLAKL